MAKDGLRVWDLRLIRRGLAELGLDWGAPPYPEAPRGKPAPFEVQFVGAELTDPKKMAEYQGQTAVADLFVNGTLGPQPVGNTVHGGIGLRVNY